MSSEPDVAAAFGDLTLVPGRRTVADEDRVVVPPNGVAEGVINIAELDSRTLSTHD